MNLQELAGKVAIVTGGGMGIGKATALELAGRGAHLAIAEMSEERALAAAAEIQKLGGQALPVVTDVSNQDSVSRMVEETLRKFGDIHILVNNAGIYPRKPWEELTITDWDRLHDVNLKSCFLCAKAVYPPLKKNRYGKIINISSVTFLLGAPANLIPYISAKGGVIGFTRALARELGEYNINVNAITPGAINTEEEHKFVTPQDVEDMVKHQSLKRRVMPVDVARVVAFLASDESSAMTGQTLNVDAGWYMH